MEKNKLKKIIEEEEEEERTKFIYEFVFGWSPLLTVFDCLKGLL